MELLRVVAERAVVVAAEMNPQELVTFIWVRQLRHYLLFWGRFTEFLGPMPPPQKKKLF